MDTQRRKSKVPIFNFECKCGNVFESIEKQAVTMIDCPICRKKAKRIFPIKPPSFNLKYNPKTDVCDWDGNKSQYYRQYNEAKQRGENVRLPEAGE